MKPRFRAASDVDVKAYGADLRADLKLGPAKVFFEGLYLSGGDKADEYKSPISLGDYQGTGTGPGGNSSYTRTNMQIMLASWDTINVSQCLVGCSGGEYGDSLGLQGRGLWHVAAGASMAFTPRLKGEANAGYAAAVEAAAGRNLAGTRTWAPRSTRDCTTTSRRGWMSACTAPTCGWATSCKDRRRRPTSRTPGRVLRAGQLRVLGYRRNGSGTKEPPGETPGAFLLTD